MRADEQQVQLDIAAGRVDRVDHLAQLAVGEGAAPVWQAAGLVHAEGGVVQHEPRPLGPVEQGSQNWCSLGLPLLLSVAACGDVGNSAEAATLVEPGVEECLAGIGIGLRPGGEVDGQESVVMYVEDETLRSDLGTDTEACLAGRGDVTPESDEFADLSAETRDAAADAAVAADHACLRDHGFHPEILSAEDGVVETVFPPGEMDDPGYASASAECGQEAQVAELEVLTNALIAESEQ